VPGAAKDGFRVRLAAGGAALYRLDPH
jgi:hypothetical protein